MQTAKNFFSETEQQKIVDAICTAEKETSGEIRVHIENFCFGNELNRSAKVFDTLKMFETYERNGILIYLAVISRKIAVIGDVGIHKQLGDHFWEQIVNDIISKFKSSNKAETLSDAIIECGKKLSMHFPRKENDINELNDSISF